MVLGHDASNLADEYFIIDTVSADQTVSNHEADTVLKAECQTQCTVSFLVRVVQQNSVFVVDLRTRRRGDTVMLFGVLMDMLCSVKIGRERIAALVKVRAASYNKVTKDHRAVLHSPCQLQVYTRRGTRIIEYLNTYVKDS
jgi:hypothetical protein